MARVPWPSVLLVLAPLLALSRPALAAAPIELAGPADRTVVRSDRALLPLRVADDQPWATDLCVEIDGQVQGRFTPWSRQSILALEPGLHRVAVLGTDARDGAATRSATLQIAVLPERDRFGGPMTPRTRNSWTAVFAFAVAITGASALRRRGPGGNGRGRP